jgi:beta-phosphoglucomutase family hydrolase
VASIPHAPGALGLPAHIAACLFDLDGVVTRTEVLHARAWAQIFDAFLEARATASAQPARPFDQAGDYDRYVDGRSRADGVRAFMASRDITLDEGRPDDPPTAPTVNGVGNAKNEVLIDLIEREGIQIEPGATDYLRAVRADGRATALVSSSENAGAVVTRAGIGSLFDVRIDGVVARNRNLRGKPAPDTFVAAAEMLGVAPGHAAVYEDALAGVAAGRAGGFGFVVGISRGTDREAALRASGADLVVENLGELLPAGTTTDRPGG